MTANQPARERISLGLKDKGRNQEEVKNTLNQSTKFVIADSQLRSLRCEGIPS